MAFADVTRQVQNRGVRGGRIVMPHNAARLAAVIQAIPDAVYFGDLSGVKFVNQRALDQFVAQCPLPVAQSQACRRCAQQPARNSNNARG